MLYTASLLPHFSIPIGIDNNVQCMNNQLLACQFHRMSGPLGNVDSSTQTPWYTDVLLPEEIRDSSGNVAFCAGIVKNAFLLIT